MFYLFELMAKTRGFSAPDQGPSATVSETATVLLRYLSNIAAFHLEQKWGPPK
jgi:hypothetical protein